MKKIRSMTEGEFLKLFFAFFILSSFAFIGLLISFVLGYRLHREK